MNQSSIIPQDDSLDADQFAAFFEERMGFPPFPWQSRLLEQILQGDWPDVMALPTGSGKTSTLDVWAFALACQADLSFQQRTVPTRLFYVVDRRIVVDEADYRACRLAADLRCPDADKPVTAAVAARLLRLAESDGRSSSLGTEISPLQCHVLRGGFYRTNAWGSSFTQPMIVAGTVDQIGSRMLFRGYGVSPQARPLQAALVGTDSLILLDEAHTAEAFAGTVGRIASQQRHEESGAPFIRPLRCIQLTATPVETTADGEHRVFNLDPDSDLSDPDSRLVQRYRQSKPVRLEIAKGVKGATATTKLAKDLVGRMRMVLSEQDDPLAVAVVVNRVHTARALAVMLEQDSKIDADVRLMIGSMRPIDRDALGEQLREQLGTGTQRDLTRPLIVVATQCLEVGADLDFDHMISEVASLDALRQRFGRLNRGGRSDCRSDGQVVIREDQSLNDAKIEKLAGEKEAEADPVYGLALIRTFHWLHQVASSDQDQTQWVDFGLEAMDRLWSDVSREPAHGTEKTCRQDLMVRRPETVCLLPAHVDLLSQTNVRYERTGSGLEKTERIGVHPDPDVSVFLHGRQSRQTDVQVCWRADLCTTVLQRESRPDESFKPNDPRVVLERVQDDVQVVAAVCDAPPASAECMTVGWGAVQAFLLGETKNVVDDSDQAGFANDRERDKDTSIDRARQPVVYRGQEGSFVCGDFRQIRPGDTLVLPVSAGGWQNLGAIPSDRPRSPDPSRDELDLREPEHWQFLASIDVADTAWLASTWRPRLRVIPWTLQPPSVNHSRGLPALARLEASPRLTADEQRELLDALANLSSSNASVMELLREIADKEAGRLSFEASGEADRSSSLGLTIRYSGPPLNRERVQKCLAGGYAEKQAESDFSDEVSELTGQHVPLAAHCLAVQQRVRTLCDSLGMRDHEASSLGEAAWMHDLGKADPRQQAFLLGCSPEEAWMRPTLIAKSRRGRFSPKQEQFFRTLSGLPNGFRHEYLSTRLAESLRPTSDELTLHAIAAHHGHARPWMPPCADAGTNKVSLHRLGLPLDYPLSPGDSAAEARARTDIAQRFWHLQQRYGVWGLAMLESIVRLSDQQASAEEAYASADRVQTQFTPLSVNNTTDPEIEPEDSRVELPGLDGANPAAFLASLGLWKLLQSATANLRMHWEVIDGGWRPVLTSTHGIDAQWLHSHFDDWTNRRLPIPLATFDQGYQPDGHSPVQEKGTARQLAICNDSREPVEAFAKGAGKIIADPSRFHHLVEQMRQAFYGGQLSRDECDLVAALGSEGVRKWMAGKEVDSIDHTQLYMTKGSGHQRMLELMRNVHAAVKPEHYDKALFHPWAYDDVGQSLNFRWDPADDRPYALRWKNPSSDPVMTVLGANDLAIEALSLFPTATVGQRLDTAAFTYRPRVGTFFSWPIWVYPVQLSVVRSWLTWGELQRQTPDRRVLAEMGIAVVYRSERKRNDKYFNFSGAEAI